MAALAGSREVCCPPLRVAMRRGELVRASLLKCVRGTGRGWPCQPLSCFDRSEATICGELRLPGQVIPSNTSVAVGVR